METYNCLECGTAMVADHYVKIDPHSKLFEVVFVCPNTECFSKAN